MDMGHWVLELLLNIENFTGSDILIYNVKRDGNILD